MVSKLFAGQNGVASTRCCGSYLTSVAYKYERGVFNNNPVRRCIALILTVSMIASVALPAGVFAQTVTPATSNTSGTSSTTLAPSGSTTETGEVPVEYNGVAPASPNASSITSGSSFTTGEDILSDKTRFRDVKLGQGTLTTKSNTGALTYSYPLTLPPGRGAVTPGVSLVYNSDDRSITNVLGFSWSLSVPSITRRNVLGNEKMYDRNDFSASADGDLVAVSGNTYRPRAEQGPFSSYTFQNNAWTVVDANGTVYQFGFSNSSRQYDPTNVNHIFKWMLETVTDANGNGIRYEYQKDTSSVGQGQIMPSRIVYTNYNGTDGPFEVKFVYGARDEYEILDFSPGFPLGTNSVLTTIQTRFGTQLLRETLLAYSHGDNGLRSMLHSITEKGYDSAQTSVVSPPITFTYAGNLGSTAFYSDTADPYSFPEKFVIYYGTNNNSAIMSDEGVRVMDMNGDAIADVIKLKEDRYVCCTVTRKLYLQTGSTTWSDQNPANFTLPTIVTFIDPDGDFIDLGVRFADVNGDVLQDIVESRTTDDSGYKRVTRKVYINDGHLHWNYTPAYIIPVDFVKMDQPRGGNDYKNVKDQGVRLEDVNGDGLTDLIQGLKDGTTTTKKVFINAGNGTGWVESSAFAPGYTIIDTAQNRDQGIYYDDVTGDGIPDLLRAYYDDRSKEAYNGITKTYPLGPPPDYLASRYETNHTGVRTLDINGDGLTDFVKALQTSTSPYYVKKVFMNNQSAQTFAAGVNATLAPQLNYYGGHTGKEPMHVRDHDINGDGLPDIVGGYGSALPRVYLNKSKVVDLLTQVHTSDGGRSDITYKPSAQYKDASNNLLNPNLPVSVQTVNRIEKFDVFGTSRGSTTYTYAGGDYYFSSPTDRRFAGFHHITETRNDGKISHSYFHQGNDIDASTGEFNDDETLIGLPYRTEIRDTNGTLYSVTHTKYNLLSLGANSFFVAPSRTTSLTFSTLGIHRDTAEDYTYDTLSGQRTGSNAYGEVTADSLTGDFTDIGQDKRTRIITYATNATAHITKQQTTELRDSTNVKVSETRIYYDGLPLGSIAKGNTTKEEAWLNTESRYLASQTTYNPYGLPLTSTNPRNKTTTYVYDAQNLYPATITNPLQHATQYIYDYSLGKAIQTTDPNGFITYTTYDGLDRPVEEKASNLAHSGLVTRKTTAYHPESSPPYTLVTEYHTGGQPPRETYTYSNGLGGTIQTRATAANQDSGAESDGTLFDVTSVTFDSVGRVSRQYVPVRMTGSSYSATSQPTTQSTETRYDVLDRTTATVTPRGTTTVAYVPWKTITTDARLHATDRLYDAFNELVSVVEHASGTPFTSTYSYDAAGNLVNITDAENNVRQFTYDSLGRQLTNQMPHVSATNAMTHSFTYDDNGNRTTHTYPGAHIANYSYDDLDRVQTIDDPVTAGTNITYAYDTAPNGIGHVASSTTAHGDSLAYEYDGLGNTSKETQITANPTGGPRTDISHYAYDDLGALIATTYPDNSVLNNTYNRAGSLETLSRSTTPFILDFDYTPAGQVERTYYQTNDSTPLLVQSTYDVNRLYELKAYQIGSLMSVAYTFDAVGNLTNLSDTGSELPRTYIYTYDDLNRILTTETTLRGTRVQQSYVYSPTGNISSVTKDGVTDTYAYADNRHPQAVTTIVRPGSSDQTFAYSPNGSLLTEHRRAGDNLTYAYDFLDRLTNVTKNAENYEYVYLADTSRIQERINPTLETSKITTYIGDLAEADKTGVITKYLSGNGLRLGTETAAGLIHSHEDYLKSFALSTTPDEQPASTREYYPFGETRYETGTAPNHTYTDQIDDSETGLMYYGARYYNAPVGRFTSADPAVLDKRITKILPDPQELNPYTYVRNNPLKFTDPIGQQLYDPLDTTWDVTAYDQSLEAFNSAQGTFDKIMTGIPLVADAVSLALPVVPAVVGPLARAESRLESEASELMPGIVKSLTTVNKESKNIFGLAEKVEMKEGETVYRVYGGKSDPLGKYWTPVDPRTVSNFRDVAGLPNINTGRFLLEGTIDRSNIMQIGPAAALDGNRGGLIQYLLNDPSKVSIHGVYGLNPEY